MKNLDFLLEALRTVQSNVSLSIFGPLREHDYWQRCQALIGSLPSNISVSYQGEVSPTHVLETFSSFDLFVLPTRGENYGHVLLESLSAGTPVLISDQTPWSASDDGGVQVMPLGEPMQWALAIDRMATMSLDQRHALRSAALRYASDYLRSSNVVQKNRDLFLAVLQRSSFSF